MDFLFDDVNDPIARVLLAHGAGAPMDSPFMTEIAGLLAERNVAVARFEFTYMAARRDSGKRKPPPRGDRLTGEYQAAVEALRTARDDNAALFIGGKSLGGRVASLAANDLHEAGAIGGLVCLGYPFHPAKKPEQLRTEHLETFDCPALIVQGTRDPLGNREEVGSYAIDPRIRFHWADDGDHDLGPRGRSGFTRRGNLEGAAEAIREFVTEIVQD